MRVKKIGVVSLSSGVLGESFTKHQVKLGVERLNNYGIDVEFLPHALKGIEFLRNYPEKRAADLIAAFKDESIDMILCAIGGNDTYRLLPYLLENDELKHVITDKVFLGFSDTTINHFTLHKLGLNTYYGQAFLPDTAELSDDMLPYSRHYFEELITTGRISTITSSNVWYEERTDFSSDSLGKDMTCHVNTGCDLINGSSTFEGKILGGCLETIYYNIFREDRENNAVEICQRYEIFPKLEEWYHKILLLETSEEKPSPVEFKEMLEALNSYGLFEVVSGILIGKPQNNTYYNEYREILIDMFSETDVPVVFNVNIGHGTPRAIVPLGVHAKVNVARDEIVFDEIKDNA